MTDKGSAYDPAGLPPANDSLKSQTSRISLESARPLKSPLEPKKSTGLVPNSPAYHGSIPQTIRLKRPPTSPITVQPIDHPPAKKPGETALVQAPTTVRPATSETVKRQTSRIDLANATATKTSDFKRSTGPILGIPMHPGPIPQTIRLKRPATATIKRTATSSIVTKTAEPGVMPRMEQPPDITEAPTVIKHVAAPKAPTSRIVLDELSASIAAKKPTSPITTPAPAEPEAPKTIRLKRPSSMSEAEETIQVAGADRSLQASKKGETAKIELPIEDSSRMPMTQRKTIKIKRTDHADAPAPRPEMPGPAAAQKPDHLVKAPVPAEDDELVVFPIVAFAATLCIAALVYIMVAQAFGVHLLLPSSMQLH